MSFLFADMKDLSCPPKVVVGEPEKSVTPGSRVQLSCHVSGNFRSARWTRGGLTLANQSQHVLTTRRLADTRLWINLTIANVDM